MNYPLSMARGRRPGGIYLGWWTVAFTGIVSGIGHGYYGYGLSVFFKDIAAELGLSRAVTSVAGGIGRLEGGIAAPVTGWLADRFGPKWLIFGGICLAGVGMAMMYLVRSTAAYFVVWGMITGLGLNLGLTIAVDQVLTNWFVRKRGLAQGIKFALIGVTGVIVLPLVTVLVAGLGWRTTCLVWGVFLLLCAPLTLVVVRQKRPEDYGLLPDGARVLPEEDRTRRDAGARPAFVEAESTFRQAVRSRAFWTIALANGFFLLVGGGFQVHIIPFLTDNGMEPQAASALMSLMVFFTIPSRLFGGILADRISREKIRFLLGGVYLLPVVGVSAFLLSRSTASVYVMLILYGFSTGAVTPLIILILGRYFGRRSFGSIFGSAMMFQAPASLLGPVYYGWTYDTSGSYLTALTLFAVLAALASVAISTAPAPRTAGVTQ